MAYCIKDGEHINNLKQAKCSENAPDILFFGVKMSILVSQFFLCKKIFFREKVLSTTMLICDDSTGMWKVDALSSKGLHLNFITTLSEHRARAAYFEALATHSLNAKKQKFYIRGPRENT